jgi:hypothetical protein
MIVEEAGEMSEVECVIAMAMQKRRDRLRRIVLLGDTTPSGTALREKRGVSSSLSLPTVFESVYKFQPRISDNYLLTQCNLHQSLFHRLINMGVPVIKI